LVKAGPEIKTSKPSCREQLIQEFVNHWYWKFALDYQRVEKAVINTKPPRVVLLADNKTGDENALVLGCIRPDCSMSVTWDSVSDLRAGE
jgi:hypothetical protein